MGEAELRPGTSKKSRAKEKKRNGHGPIIWCPINLWWLSRDGRVCPAPTTKLILYPQYSEARLSGFLRGGKNAPKELLSINQRGKEPGRILVLAPLPDGRVIGCVYSRDEPEARAITAVEGEAYGVMQRFDLNADAQAESSKETLLRELGRISRLNWVDPVKLLKNGSRGPCKGTNCGGVTLETYLGIRPNGYAEPDFHGWEIKQHGVKAWGHLSSSPITLMTPEPDGGSYYEEGPIAFIRKYGYPDKSGKPDRINFGGRYCVGGEPNKSTGLRLVLAGYDTETGDYANDGAITLLDRSDNVAASWSFLKLMNHWKRKHAKAAFVESMIKRDPTQYRYGLNVLLAEGGSFSGLLGAFASGVAFYDPALKIESSSTEHASKKCRNQFRVSRKSLNALYATTSSVEV